MAPTMLTGLSMNPGFNTYIDGLHAVLTHKGWLNCPKYALNGMTAMSFRFTVNRRLTAESATCYNWMAEHFVAADLLGVLTSQNAGFHFQPTFPLYQEHAIHSLKQAVRNDTGALIWKDGFVVVAGFDDEREVLFYSDGSGELRELPFSQFGRNVSPYWYYQLYEDMGEINRFEIYKESLLQAINKWESHDIMLPESEYACGRAAYAAMGEALKNGDFDTSGGAETIRHYAVSKQDSAKYVRMLADVWPLLEGAVHAFDQAADGWSRMVRVLEDSPNRQHISDPMKLFPLLMESRNWEDEGIQRIRSFLSEDVHNRFEQIGLR